MTAKVPDGIFWPVWRLVLEGFATLQEVETHYSLLDVFKANELLDLKRDVERRAGEQKR